MTIHPQNRLNRTLATLISGILYFSLSACSQTDNKSTATDRHFMFWPPAPDAPHIQFLTSISNSAEITGKQTDVQDFLFGADKQRGLPFFRPYGIRMFEGKIYLCDASAGNLSVL